MTVRLDIQNATDPLDTDVPTKPQLVQWVTLVLAHCKHPKASLCIRWVDAPEIQTLNREYRQKDKPTNVLSFPANLPKMVRSDYLGDLVICPTIIQQEALEQAKLSEAHFAHMVIHGTLHLLGFDHVEPTQAHQMETLETHLLSALGYENPYEDPI